MHLLFFKFFTYHDFVFNVGMNLDAKPLPLFFMYTNPSKENTAAPMKFTNRSCMVSYKPMSRYLSHVSPFTATLPTST